MSTMTDPQFQAVYEAIKDLWPGEGGLLGLDEVYRRVTKQGTPMTVEQFTTIVAALESNELIGLGGAGTSFGRPTFVNSEAIEVDGEQCINRVYRRRTWS